MTEKADSSGSKKVQAAAKQAAGKQQPAPETALQDPAVQLASSLDATDAQRQVTRLADTRIPAVQRQDLAGHIGRRQGNRHLTALLSQRPPIPSATTPMIQREALPDIVGQQLATMHFSDESRNRAEGRIVVEEELVPAGQQAGQFDGFGQRIQAISRSAAETNICAVAEDRQGKFHALRSGWSGRDRGIRATFTEEPNNFRSLRFVNRPGRSGALVESGPRSWQGRVSRARDWLSHMNRHQVPPDFAGGCRHSPAHDEAQPNLAQLRRCLEVEFAELLAVALDIGRDEVHIIPSGGQADPNALVNFNIEQTDRGRGGIGHLPRDPSEAVRRPSVTIGPPAFESESELSVIATAIHESEHVRQAQDASALLQQWRSAGTRQDFPDWLRRQMRRRRNPITQEQHDLALELWNAGNRSAEILSYIEGFIRTYARRPITSTSYRFDSLNTVARFWTASGSQTIKDEGIQRLATFYGTLDDAHRQDLADHARDMAGRAAATHRPFWQRVVSDVL